MATASMDDVLRHELQRPDLICLGEGDCEDNLINDVYTYQDINGEKLFVKVNKKSESRRMFNGEFASLECLHAMDVVKVPKPIKVVDMPTGGTAFVMEHLEFKALHSQSAKLGELIARLHLKNSELEEKAQKSDKFVGRSGKYNFVDKFGFDVETFTGYIPQDNTWCSNWATFFARKLQTQMDLINKNYGDREALELWSKLQLILPSFFEGLEIKPALMHGDLWRGNVGENKDGPVVFDPASFYGHSEYDLVMARMFEGFSPRFFDAYHNVIPQANGATQRLELYKLFQYLNHWNHFPEETVYRISAIRIMKDA